MVSLLCSDDMCVLLSMEELGPLQWQMHLFRLCTIDKKLRTASHTKPGIFARCGVSEQNDRARELLGEVMNFTVE